MGGGKHRFFKWQDSFVVSKEMLNSHLQWKRGLRVFLSPLVINYPHVNIGHRRGMASQRCAHSLLTWEVLFKRCTACPPSALPHVQHYTSANVRSIAAVSGPNIPRLAHFPFPDVRISPFPSDNIGTVFSLKLQQHASKNRKHETYCLFFLRVPFIHLVHWKT